MSGSGKGSTCFNEHVCWGVTVSACAALAVPGIAHGGVTWTKPAGASGSQPAAGISTDGKTTYAAWLDNGTVKVAVDGKVKSVGSGAYPREEPALAVQNAGAGLLFGSACNTASAKVSFVGSPDKGSTWTAPVVVANEPCAALSLHSSSDGQKLMATWLASTDVAFDDSPTVSRVSNSADGGKTWTTATDMPWGETPAAPLYALSSDGSKAVAVAMRSKRGDKAIQVARSDDGGKTWTQGTDVVQDTVDLLGLDMDASADLTHVALSWMRSPDSGDQLHTSVSDDAGATWGKATAVGKKGEYPDARVAISDDGKKAATIWMQNTSTWSQKMLYSRSTNGGKTWKAAKVAVGSKTGKFFPSFEMSTDGKRMIVLWSGALSKNGKRAVGAATSTGKSWKVQNLQKTKGAVLGTQLAASASAKRAIAAWQVGAKTPKVYRSSGKIS